MKKLLIFLFLIVGWYEVRVMADAETNKEAINANAISANTFASSYLRVMANAEMNEKAIKAVAISANTFASSFFKTVANGEVSNFVCSPFSASMVLSIVAYGARGNTMNQMRSILALPENDTLAQRGFRLTVDSFSKFKSVTIQLANKVFLASIMKPKQEFEAVTTDAFNSAVQTVDFSNSVQASKTINEWCETQTNHHIKDVIKADDLDWQTAAVLVTAVYFKGQWANRFDVTKTSARKFNINDTTSKEVSTMFKASTFHYGELPEVNATFIELPYKRDHWRDSIRMFIVLPDQIDGLAEVERNIDKVTLKKLDAGEKCKVRVYLPKFKIESEFVLNETLQSMGLVDMFDEDKANFTGIVDYPPLFVKKVVQKAFIEVNEEGSEATALTSIDLRMVASGGGYGEPRCNVDFNVNRPAVFIIATKDVILFSGSLKNPSQN